MASLFWSKPSQGLVVVVFQLILLFWKDVLAIEPPKVEPFTFSPRKPDSGATVRSMCTVSQGDHPLSITWLLDGKKIERDNVVIRHMDEMSKNIKITSLSVLDIGNYTCVATNSAGFDSYTLPLKFQGPPKWIMAPQEEVDILVGNIVSLSCQASGYPIPIVTWHKDSNC